MIVLRRWGEDTDLMDREGPRKAETKHQKHMVHFRVTFLLQHQPITDWYLVTLARIKTGEEGEDDWNPPIGEYCLIVSYFLEVELNNLISRWWSRTLVWTTPFWFGLLGQTDGLLYILFITRPADIKPKGSSIPGWKKKKTERVKKNMLRNATRIFPIVGRGESPDWQGPVRAYLSKQQSLTVLWVSWAPQGSSHCGQST